MNNLLSLVLPPNVIFGLQARASAKDLTLEEFVSWLLTWVAEGNQPVGGNVEDYD